MTDILESIAELTHLRNRHELAHAFAGLVHQYSGAICLTLWHVSRTSGAPQLQIQVTLPRRNGNAAGHKSVIEPECRRYLETKDTGCAVDQAARHEFPIHDGSRVSGLLEIVRPEPFTKLEQHMLIGLIRVYGNHAGLLDYGERDDLTGLLNRRSFTAVFNHKTQAEKCVLAVADIDFFKRINDEFGHTYGDEVLILMARLMESCLAEVDSMFRFGGEEFVIMLPGQDLDDAWHTLEIFRNAVQQAVFPQVGRVTVSIGMSAVLPGDTGATSFGRADEALYVAKQRGRNQVQCHESLVLEGCLTQIKKESSPVELF